MEEIDPKGDNILIQGIYVTVIFIFCDFILNDVFAGCGPVGLFAIGIAKVMGASKM